jgi:hypothetical protein
MNFAAQNSHAKFCKRILQMFCVALRGKENMRYCSLDMMKITSRASISATATSAIFVIVSTLFPFLMGRQHLLS